MGSISQMPVVLIPIHFDRNYQEIAAFPSCQRSVVLRPFVTCDFMTGVPALPGEHIPLQVTPMGVVNTDVISNGCGTVVDIIIIININL